MILIYSHISSTRLQYICKFIFDEQLGIPFSLTIDSEGFKKHEGPKINYSDLLMDADAFNLPNHTLLFENNIAEQDIRCFDTPQYKAFFKIKDANFPFDVLAAGFYLLSRYEEYLPHKKDGYGRYAHENAIAFKEGFLQLPLINIWLIDLARALQHKFPTLIIKQPGFKFIPTYDIDMAWSYKSKGIVRNIGGFIKSPSFKRLTVLTGLTKDPFDCYEYLKSVHQKFLLDPVYFFLVATSGSKYDKNISPYDHSMWQLIKKHAKQFTIGLHPSWKSNEKPTLLNKEKQILETAAGKPINSSRQHYIKFSLPQTFECLLAAGITNDYSMGYGSINGFRASVASPHFWYNLTADKVTPLRLYPFCFMDANSFYEQKQTISESAEELDDYYKTCKAVNGQMMTIFHNHFLGADKTFNGWRKLYDKFITQLQQ